MGKAETSEAYGHETSDERKENTMAIDGCKVTVRFANKSNASVLNEIKKILLDSCV